MNWRKWFRRPSQDDAVEHHVIEIGKHVRALSAIAGTPAHHIVAVVFVHGTMVGNQYNVAVGGFVPSADDRRAAVRNAILTTIDGLKQDPRTNVVLPPTTTLVQ